MPNLFLLMLISSCQSSLAQGLKEHFEKDFFIGTSLNLQQVNGTEKGVDSLLMLHFNSITSENGLKWGPVQPKQGEYRFDFGDAFVEMGEKMEAFIVGHTLVWHQQTPEWVFQDGEGRFMDRENLLDRMEGHISTLVGRYKGRIDAWDVVNEAFEDDGSWRKTNWYNLIGEDYIERAFRKANEIDPEAQLIYNDYNVWKPEKRKAILDMAKTLKAKGVRIDGIGLQGHYRLNSPSLEQIEQAILDIHEAGFDAHVTELDVDILPRPTDVEGADVSINFAQSEQWNPYRNGLPKAKEEELILRYTSLFQLFKKHRDKIKRVTFWGLYDGSSWLNNWPVRGRINYPLLFDREKRLKEGFWSEF